MERQSKKTSFLLYPFKGAYSLFSWSVIGMISVLSAIFKSPNKSSDDMLKTNALLIDSNIKSSDSINDIVNNTNKKYNTDSIDKPKLNEQLVDNQNQQKKIIKDNQLAKKKQLQEEKNYQRLMKREGNKLKTEKELLMKDLASGDVKRTDKPVAFKYKAIDPHGKLVTGTFTGSSKLDVNAFLVNEGYDVYKIETSDWINFLYGQSNFGVGRLSKKDLVFWLTQLYTYVKAGIPLTDAVKILSNQMGKKRGLRKRNIVRTRKKI